MIVYFEDGSLIDENRSVDIVDGAEFIRVDAGIGYSNCRKMLRYIKDHFPFDIKVYTNSLDAFSNFWCWDDEKKIPMIYIKDKNGKWKLISELTTKELRMAHNLEKLYVNGVFCDVAQ